MSNKENNPPDFSKVRYIIKCGACKEIIPTDGLPTITAKKMCIAPCKHIFCFNCMEMNIITKNKKDCPICNKEFDDKFCKSIEKMQDDELNILKSALNLRKMR